MEGDKLIEFVDSEGVSHWVEVNEQIADLLMQTEPKLKERLFRKPEGLDRVAEKQYGDSWEGPRLRFRWLIGEGWPWYGDLATWETIETASGELVTRCRWCKGNKLPSYAYCLGCDRCGRELDIRPAEAKAAKNVMAEVRDGLKGGCGGRI